MASLVFYELTILNAFVMTQTSSFDLITDHPWFDIVFTKKKMFYCQKKGPRVQRVYSTLAPERKVPYKNDIIITNIAISDSVNKSALWVQKSAFSVSQQKCPLSQQTYPISQKYACGLSALFVVKCPSEDCLPAPRTFQRRCVSGLKISWWTGTQCT